MYAAIRRYRLKDPAQASEVESRVDSFGGFASQLTDSQGFVDYYILETGEGELMSVSVFEDRQEAEASTRRSADWVAENLAGYFEGAPEVTTAEVRLHIDRSQRRPLTAP